MFQPLVVLAVVAGNGLAPEPRYAIESTPTQTVTAVIAYEVRTTTFAATRVTAYLPEPPELPSQTGVRVTGAPAGRVVREASRLARGVRRMAVT